MALLVFSLGRATFERFSGVFKYLKLGGGIFIILLGALMALGKSFGNRYCQALHKVVLEKDKKSIIFLGLTMGVVPCAPLITVLSTCALIAKSWPESLSYGVLFGLGTTISPLLILVIFSGIIPRFIEEKSKAYGRVFTLICALIIIYLGIRLLI